MATALSNSDNSEDDADNTIKVVWASNLKEEFETICKLVDTHRYIAMDTEFPGVVIERPLCKFQHGTPEYEYEKIRRNVDRLKIIQLGLTFMDDNGSTASKLTPYTTWQFNFKFDILNDEISVSSKALLLNSRIPFKRLREEGIEPKDFGSLMYGTGGILLRKAKWITFQGGFDFGYLLKMLSNNRLPSTKSEFEEDLKLYFNSFYDVKYLMERYKVTGSLKKSAKDLGIEIVGAWHNAGSDSLTTAKVFYAIGPSAFEEYNRRLIGLSK